MTTPLPTPLLPWPTCPMPTAFPLITGFITPGSDPGPGQGGLAGSIVVDVTDPTEAHERIRVVETDTDWDLTVEWCICGPFAPLLCGCWCLQVFIDDIDGVGTTSGLLDSKQVDNSTGVVVSPNQICFEYTFPFKAGRVTPGVYNVVVVITLAAKPCDQNPTHLADDVLGYAVIPVLVFYDEDAPFCPKPKP